MDTFCTAQIRCPFPYPEGLTKKKTFVEELESTPAFWRKRIDEQIEYIARNNGKVREEVIESALTILEQCQQKYFSFSQPERVSAIVKEIVESNNRDEWNN